MTILKVYDTVIAAKHSAINDYRDYITKGLDVKFHAIYPYKIKINDDCYVYGANNNSKCLLGMKFNEIEDYTRTVVCDEIRACEYDNT